MARGHRTLSGKGAITTAGARAAGTMKANHRDLPSVAPAEPEVTYDGLSARDAMKRAEPILWRFDERRRKYTAKITDAGAQIADSEDLLRIDVKAAGILPRHEQRALVAAAQAGSDRARHLLTVANQGMVHSVAHTYSALGVSHEDLVQEGNLGLQQAISRYSFDFADANAFLTYATWWIRQPISKAVQERGGPMAIPGYLNLVRTRVVQSISALEGRGIDNPTRQQLHDEVQSRSPKPVRPEHIDAAVELLERSFTSLDMTYSAGTDAQGVRVGDRIADERVNLDAQMQDEDLRAAITASLEALTPLQRTIITRRFGLDGKVETSALQMQEELGLTKGSFDNHVKRAMQTLRAKLSERQFNGLEGFSDS